MGGNCEMVATEQLLPSWREIGEVRSDPAIGMKRGL